VAFLLLHRPAQPPALRGVELAVRRRRRRRRWRSPTTAALRLQRRDKTVTMIRGTDRRRLALLLAQLRLPLLLAVEREPRLGARPAARTPPTKRRRRLPSGPAAQRCAASKTRIRGTVMSRLVLLVTLLRLALLLDGVVVVAPTS
jgi:hypothetical protein